MSRRRLIKSNTAVDVVRGYLILLLSVLILGDFPGKPRGARVFFDSITPFKNIGYKNITAVHRYPFDPVRVQSVIRGICLAFASRKVDSKLIMMDTMDCSDDRRMANKGGEAITVIGQRVADLITTSHDNGREYVGIKAAQKGQMPVVFFCGVNLNSSQSGLTGQPMLNLDMAQEPGLQSSDDVVCQANILIGTDKKIISI